MNARLLALSTIAFLAAFSLGLAVSRYVAPLDDSAMTRARD